MSIRLEPFVYRGHLIVVGGSGKALVHASTGGPILHEAESLAAAIRWIDEQSSNGGVT